MCISNGKVHISREKICALSFEQRTKLNDYERIKFLELFSLGFQADRTKLDLDFGATERSGHRSLRIAFLNAAAKIKFLNSLGHFASNKFLRQLLQDPTKPLARIAESNFRPHY